ncbi:DUF3008 family protein [Burkholderia contaminans]|uniref:DUF3008 family protein n=1 Tax=Burkholderia contaminans TaxID=488447 RepID=UPI0034E97FD3
MMAARARPSRAHARADRRVDACVHDRRATMRAKSQARRRTACAAPSAGRGRTNVQDLVPQAKSAAGSMSTRKRVKTASTPKRGKPEHKYDA